MLDYLISIGLLKLYIFWGLVILGLAVFVGYFTIMDRKTDRYHRSKFRDRCDAERTKYYD